MNLVAFFRSLDKNVATLTCMVLILLVLVLWSIGSFRDFAGPTKVEVAESTNNAMQSGAKSSSLFSSRAPSPAGTASIVDDKTAALQLEIMQTRNDHFRESLKSFGIKFDRTRELLDELASRLNELASNDTGRKIASSDVLVRGFLAYQEWGDELGKQFKEMILERSLLDREVEFHIDSNSEELLEKRVGSRLKNLLDSINQIAKETEIKSRGLATIVIDASKLKTSALTLSERITSLSAEEERQVLQAASDERVRVHLQNIELAKEAERNRERAGIELQIAKAEEEAKSLDTEKEVTRARAENLRQLAVLKTEMSKDWPKIQHYLGPLLVKSTSQPSGRGMVETKTAMPVSLSGLKEFGYSNPDISKACSSLLLFFSYYKSAGRGDGPYPTYLGAALNDGEMKAIRPAFDLLEKYGLLLVEEGKLSK